MTRNEFLGRLQFHFGFPPTESQTQAMSDLASFIYEPGDSFLFILKGYAGTGKTTLTGALIKSLEEVRIKCVILAPTGRAAKVISQHAGRKAYTIHKWIYRTATKDGIRKFYRKENKYSHTLFIVDEASMISAQASGEEFAGGYNLLDDLIGYVFSKAHNRMLFIGDDAQLPPVGESESPALNPDYMRHTYPVRVFESSLTDVVRQALDSGILYNATLLRGKIARGETMLPFFGGKQFSDFVRITGSELEEVLNELYSNYASDEIVSITSSNRRAFMLNSEIRNRILYRESRINAGDFIMAVKNNYYWVDETSEVGFLANGDIMEVMAIHRQQELYGFTFADVTVRLCDYPAHPDIDIKIILESLDIEAASLPYEDLRRLYQAVAEDYAEIPDTRARFLKTRNDPYLNAVQVKFAYALTCHKTQGGQWKKVLIDQGYLSDDRIGLDYMRWLYTAVTRSTQTVYLINFKDTFFIADGEQ